MNILGLNAFHADSSAALVRDGKAVQQRTGLTDLALAGGCAMNSVANGKIRRMTPFQRIYVQAASGDAAVPSGRHFPYGINLVARARS